MFRIGVVSHESKRKLFESTKTLASGITGGKAAAVDYKLLLENCQKFGAIQFSSIARIAFIATILLKTISNVSKIKNDEIAQIINSISTPVTDFQNDLLN